jgi:hypothetical protein
LASIKRRADGGEEEDEEALAHSLERRQK